MATVAVYNSKGGVGKTTIALNLAGQAALAGYRVLLWEFDSQGDCGWLLGGAPAQDKTDLGKVMLDLVALETFIVPTGIANLSLLMADGLAQNTDNLFNQLVRQQKLLRLFAKLDERFDVVVFDCPPGGGDANMRLLQNVDLIVSPSLPSPLAMRGLMRLRDLIVQARGRHAPILPVFSMVDMRRKLHREAIAQQPDWPVIPYMSAIEQMLIRKAPVCNSAPKSQAAALFGTLWQGIETKLRRRHLIRRRAPITADPGVVPRTRVAGRRSDSVRPTGLLSTARHILTRPSQAIN